MCALIDARLPSACYRTKTAFQNFLWQSAPAFYTFPPWHMLQSTSIDSLLWAFSITLHCTAVGGINLLVWMHATLDGLVGMPQASSVSCASIHLGFCVLLSSLPAAAGTVYDCTTLTSSYTEIRFSQRMGLTINSSVKLKSKLIV